MVNDLKNYQAFISKSQLSASSNAAHFPVVALFLVDYVTSADIGRTLA